MNRRAMKLLWTVLIIGLMAASCGGQNAVTYSNPAPVPATYFGLHIGFVATPWPTAFQPGAIRIWDVVGAQWDGVNTSSGSYTWTTLDSAVNQATSNGATVLYNLGRTPSWASSNPTGSCAQAAGVCYPPSDLTVSNGVWSSPTWSAWVTAVVQRYCGRVTAYELWNEPDDTFWAGTQAQLVGLAQIAYPIIHSTANCTVSGANPNVLLSAPASGMVTPLWLESYLGSGGGAYADKIAFHGYTSGSPATFLGPYSQLRSYVSGASFAALNGAGTMTDTEGGFGQQGSLPAPTDQAAWLARMYLIGWANGVNTFYWYQYDNNANNNGNGPWGQMYSASGLTAATYASGGETCSVGDVVTVTQTGAYSGQLLVTSTAPITLSVYQIGYGYSTASGLATTGGAGCAGSLVVNITAGTTTNTLPAVYSTVQGWMLGATESCTRYSDATWSCSLKNGSTSYAVWNDNGSGYYKVPAGIGHYKDVYGNITTTSAGNTVSLTASPLLFY